MSAKIYVGNLSWNTTDDALRQAFSPYGQVLDSIVMRDRDTGRSRGFGFVTYGSPTEAEAAIHGLNEQELDGRRLKVNMANARATTGGPGGLGFGASPGGFGGGYGGGAYPGGQGYGAVPGYGGGGGFSSQGGFYGAQPGYQGGGGYPGYQQQSGGGYGY